MPEFCIKSEEIEQIIQLSILQGGSKYRQKDVYALLDRVVARGPVKDFAENTFSRYQVCAPCKNCKKGIFRSVKI